MILSFEAVVAVEGWREARVGWEREVVRDVQVVVGEVGRRSAEERGSKRVGGGRSPFVSAGVPLPSTSDISPPSSLSGIIHPNNILPLPNLNKLNRSKHFNPSIAMTSFSLCFVPPNFLRTDISSRSWRVDKIERECAREE